MKYFYLILTLLAAAALVFTGACKDNRVNFVEREDLFSLEIGPMEDQIALFKLEGTNGAKHTGFTMRDGQIYIADGTGAKVVRYNSYGDLLFMIYNEETNPPPINLRSNISPDEQITRWAFTYALRQPGWITVDSRRHIFVQDKLPPQSHRTDSENNALLDGIILHFDQDGRFINYLGREGIGGSPFPRIIGLSTSVNNELVVICRIPDGWNIYWYSSNGVLIYFIKINENTIPSYPDWPEAIASLDKIAATPDARKLYLKVDYYRDTVDQSTNTRTALVPLKSVIWSLNIEDGVYSNPLDVPLFEISDNDRPSGIITFYSLLGVTRGGKALLYVPVETGYSILYLNINSREQRRGIINFSNSELHYSDFFLSAEGILCAMLVDEFDVKMVWWRTDRLMGESL